MDRWTPPPSYRRTTARTFCWVFLGLNFAWAFMSALREAQVWLLLHVIASASLILTLDATRD